MHWLHSIEMYLIRLPSIHFRLRIYNIYNHTATGQDGPVSCLSGQNIRIKICRICHWRQNLIFAGECIEAAICDRYQIPTVVASGLIHRPKEGVYSSLQIGYLRIEGRGVLNNARPAYRYPKAVTPVLRWSAVKVMRTIFASYISAPAVAVTSLFVTITISEFTQVKLMTVQTRVLLPKPRPETFEA